MTKQIKTRIVFDGEPLVMSHFSGVGHYILELLRAIDRQLSSYPMVKVYIFVHYRQFKKAAQYEFKNIQILKSPYSLRISNGLKRRNKQPPLDLLFGKGVYVFTNFSSWPLVRSKNIPFIYDISFEKYPQFAAPSNQTFLSAEVKKSVKRSSYIATISQNSKEEIAGFYDYPVENIGIFYPAVDTDRWYKRSKTAIELCKKQYDLPKKYILFVGNIEPRKNLIKLLQAYEKLPEILREEYKLLLVGAKGWQDGEIHQTISHINKSGSYVIMPSSYVTDEDLPSVMSGASLFVYPSLYEGFGIPPIEAMSCGVPVVTANNSSLPEAAGDAAMMVEALSTDSIAEAMKKVLESKALQERLVVRGYEQVEKFSWDKTASAFIDTAVAVNKAKSS